MLVSRQSFPVIVHRPHEPSEAGGRETSHRVTISAGSAIKRQSASGDGFAVEIVQIAGEGRIEQSFLAPLHLLVVCARGAREEGATTVGDLPPSTLHSLARKLTFVPAGQPYHDWQETHTPTRLIYIYLAPHAVRPLTDGTELRPRLLFEDKTLWDSALKLRAQIEGPGRSDSDYLDALAAVLIHELIHVGQGIQRSAPPVRGGLAGWQQRTVTAYIEEHLTEAIPLMMLARLVRLSPHYFCRAFKQSFGLPPHRYHAIQRIEHAKALLASSAYSVTEIGVKLGFSETSSFCTAFRKATGMSPTAYCRSLD